MTIEKYIFREFIIFMLFYKTPPCTKDHIDFLFGRVLIVLLKTLCCPNPHVHTHNRLIESLIKCIQIIALTYILRIKLNFLVWGHAILHAITFIRLCPIAFHL